MNARKHWEFAQILCERPEPSILDWPNLIRGFQFSLAAMWPEVFQLNLLRAVPELPCPVFMFLGRHDNWVPAEFSLAYFDQLVAPSKSLVWF